MPDIAHSDILVRLRQQAAVCKAQGFPQTHDFLSEAADELEQARFLLHRAEKRMKLTLVPKVANG